MKGPADPARKRKGRVTTLPLTKDELIALWGKMQEDGITFELTEEGFIYYVNRRYEITLRSLRTAWGLSKSQGNRLTDMLLRNPSLIST